MYSAKKKQEESNHFNESLILTHLIELSFPLQHFVE